MKPEVIIIGGGISGLSAARLLNRRGVPFLLLESESKLGGRIQSEYYDGYILDKGFQILNTAYPEWEKHDINLNALSLKSFASGAKIFQDNQAYTLADPLREGPVALLAVFTKSVSVNDMLLILKLKSRLSKKDFSEVFDMKNESTLQFLKRFGFSQKFISSFFKPFYAGIFLESELKTPSSMFSFVFKAFAEGTAALPEKGMQQLIKLISAELNNENIRFSTKVSEVQSGSVTLEDGTVLAAPHIWVTTGTGTFQGVHRKNWVGNHSTAVLYFSADKSPKWGKFIGLNANTEGIINHFCMPSAVQSGYSPEGKCLLSVSLKPGIDYKPGLEEQVIDELKKIKALQQPVDFLKAINVTGALPEMDSMCFEPELIRLHEGVLATGDFAAYPSANAALHAGRLLVETI